MVSTELREVLVRNNKIIKKHIVLFFFFWVCNLENGLLHLCVADLQKWIITLWLSIVR